MTSALRRFAERAGRDYRFRTRLPAKFGSRPIWLSPGNHLAVLKPGSSKFETYLLGFAERFVGADSVVWDVGANMGIFAVAAAHRARRTVAFEPDSFNVELLHKSMRDNPDLVLDVLPVAMSDTLGVGRFAIAERGRSANSLEGCHYGTQMGGVRQKLSVMTITADWALDQFDAPDFVKCDAEGAEALILRGATRLLGEVRPLVVIEMCKENAEESAAILHANDYAMFSAYVPIDPADALERIDSAWDVLAIPREKVEAYVGR